MLVPQCLIPHNRQELTGLRNNILNSKEFFALPEAERQRILSQHERFKITLGVHAEKVLNARLQDIASGKIKIEEADIIYNRDEPGAEYVVLKLRD